IWEARHECHTRRDCYRLGLHVDRSCFGGRPGGCSARRAVLFRLPSSGPHRANDGAAAHRPQSSGHRRRNAGVQVGSSSAARDGPPRKGFLGGGSKTNRPLVWRAEGLRRPIMTEKRTSRRQFLKAAAAGAALLPLPAIAQGAGGRVVVVGGGFGGASCAHFIKRIDPRITVTL